jgi:CheY-like chemotaxis protein
MAREKGLELTFVPCSLSVRSDRALLRRMLQNLVSNAVKYTPQGKVLVGCRRRGDTLRIDIYDTGVGIPRSKRAEIFKEFHRLDHGAKIARGLGLGLSIVERLSRVLDHAVLVDSDGATGSHFSVTVPLAVGVTQPAMTAPAPRPPQKSLQGKLIACIDNDPAILDGMRTLLEGWGARVMTALDPASAMDEINETGDRPLGLLVDYHLDRGNGIAAIRDIRRLFGPTMPAILITADRSPHVREAATREGVVVLHKPVKPAALRALLSQWRTPDVVAAE